MSNQLTPIKVRVRKTVPLRRDKVYSAKLYTGYMEARIETIDYLNITFTDYPSIPVKTQLLKQLTDLIKEYGDSPDKLIEKIGSLYGNIGVETYYSHIRLSGKPIIPGTSLKGAVRSRLELLLQAHNNVNISCFTYASPPPKTPPQPRTHGWRHKEIWLTYGTLLEVRERCSIGRWVEYFEDINICKICDLFGNTGIIGKIFFGTFYAKCDDCITVLDAVFSCSRNRKGLVEAVKPGTIFEGGISFNGLTLEELGLLFIGLGLNGCPILLGRFKYRWMPICINKNLSLVRFGRVKISIERIRFPYYMEEKLRGQGIAYRREGIYLVVDDVEKFIGLAIREAYNKYGMYLPNPNSPNKCEANILDNILSRTKQGRMVACRNAC